MAIGYCRCLRLSVRRCVNHLLVLAITRDPFKLGSPNLNHRCKRPWLRSLLFWGVIDLYLQGQIYVRSQNLPHFELLGAITPHPFKLGPPNLDHMFKIPWSSSVHENHWTCRTFPMARPKCPMRDITNLNRIHKAHRTNVWWIMKVFRVHWLRSLLFWGWLSLTCQI